MYVCIYTHFVLMLIWHLKEGSGRKEGRKEGGGREEGE
jgi:hypothetical protein